jgi:hypothetical protein
MARKRIFFAVIAACSTLGACRSPTDEDPSGYWARVQGVVRELDGTSRAGAEVTASQCTGGTHSFVGSVRSGSDGRYDLWAHIPVFPEYPPPVVPDTVRCIVQARYATRIGTDSVRLVFKSNRSEVRPVTVDLVLRP